MDGRYTFPRSRKLRGKEQYNAVFDAQVRQTRGPIMMAGRPNELGHCRMGLSISRRCGNAVVRNRIKRLLREAFRMHQHDLPTGYDLVVVVRPHGPMILAEYQKTMSHLMLKLHRTWQEKGRREGA